VKYLSLQFLIGKLHVDFITEDLQTCLLTAKFSYKPLRKI